MVADEPRPEREPFVPPPPPPPSAATRRAIAPDPAGSNVSAPRRRRKLVAIVVVAALVVTIAVVAVLVTRGANDDAGTTPSTTTAASPVTTGGGATQPGPPPGAVDPAGPEEASSMLALRDESHVGFERVVVDFEDHLPPRVESVAPDRTAGRVRVVFDEPRPTRAIGATTLTVDGPSLVSRVQFVVDADRTYVDIYTKVAVDALSFRLGDVAFDDGSTHGVVVVDVVPR